MKCTISLFNGKASIVYKYIKRHAYMDNNKMHRYVNNNSMNLIVYDYYQIHMYYRLSF